MSSVIAHRGASGLRPENTLASFALALDIGVDGLELDVQLTSDGVVAVYHDLKLKPETTRDPAGNWLGKAGPALRSLTFEELRSYDVGRLKPGTLYARRYPEQVPVDGERIPRLEEVIHLLADTGSSAQLWIELKTDPDHPEDSADPIALADRVIAVLQDHGFIGRSVLISFDWRGLLRARRISPEIRLGFITWSRTIRRAHPGRSDWSAGLSIDDFGGSLPEMIKACGGDFWSASLGDLSPARVAEARKTGLGINAWTLRRASERSRFLGLGVDCITTDRPDWLSPFRG